jgi:hypothetical protein
LGDPEASPLVKLAMSKLGIKDIKKLAAKQHLDLARLETAC